MSLDQKDLIKKLPSEEDSWEEYAANLPEEEIKIVDNLRYQRRSWYSKWWGILIILFVLLLLVWALFFISITKDYMAKIEAGTIHYDMKYRTYDFNTQEDLLAITKSDDDQRWGNENAPIVIVEFADYTCPHCQDFNNKIMPKLKEDYADDILFIFRDYPIMSTAAGESLKVANLVNCIYRELENKEDYWKVHNYIFFMGENTSTIHEDFSGYYDKEKVQECVDNESLYNEIMEDYYVANELELTGTPAFYVNGHLMRGGIPYEEWQYLLNRFLNNENIN